MSNMIFPLVTEVEKKLPFYLNGIGCRYHQEHVKRITGYPAFQWIQCHHGEGELLIDGAKYTIRPQQGMFLYPNTPHEYYETGAPWEVDWIGFDGYQATYMVQAIGFKTSTVCFINHPERILTQMRRILNIAQSNNSFKSLDCSGIIYELLLDLYKNVHQKNENPKEKLILKVQPVLDFMEINYGTQLTLADLAQSIKVSPQHLCVLFKNTLRVRPFEYLNNLRITKSKDLLLSQPKLEIKKIANLVGFENTNYYCHLFKKIEGASPNRFRRLYGIYR